MNTPPAKTQTHRSKPRNQLTAKQARQLQDYLAKSENKKSIKAGETTIEAFRAKAVQDLKFSITTANVRKQAEVMNVTFPRGGSRNGHAAASFRRSLGPVARTVLSIAGDLEISIPADDRAALERLAGQKKSSEQETG